MAFETPDGERLWAHTNNSGSMLGLIRPGAPVLVSPAANPARKLPYTLEMIRLGDMWVGVNTLTPNRLLKAAFAAGRLPFAAGYEAFQAEAALGDSRLDGVFTGPGLSPLWVEAKNVTLVEDGVAVFPDAVTERGQKHLAACMEIAARGERAAFFYCVQRADGSCFGPADYIDPAYAALFWRAVDAGVEVYPYRVEMDEAGISLGGALPLGPRV